MLLKKTIRQNHTLIFITNMSIYHIITIINVSYIHRKKKSLNDLLLHDLLLNINHHSYANERQIPYNSWAFYESWLVICIRIQTRAWKYIIPFKIIMFYYLLLCNNKPWEYTRISKHVCIYRTTPIILRLQ